MEAGGSCKATGGGWQRHSPYSPATSSWEHRAPEENNVLASYRAFHPCGPLLGFKPREQPSEYLRTRHWVGVAG